MRDAGTDTLERLASVTGYVMRGWPAMYRQTLGILVAPDLVLAPVEILEGKFERDPATPAFGFGEIEASEWTAATVAAVDVEAGAVALRLAQPANPVGGFLGLARELPANLHEQALDALIVTNDRPRRGRSQPLQLVGRAGDGGLHLRAVGAGERPIAPDEIVEGGPVTAGGALVGILGRLLSESEGLLSAIDMTAVLRGPIGSLLRGGARSAGKGATPTDVPTPGGADEDARPVLSATLAGYVSEQARARDALDIRSEVNALCSVVAARNVKPPLAIGLFGDWGSGKSFFMDRMERRLDRLAEAARRAAADGRADVAFCRKIVQIRFNAWHYMDQNLWASVVQRVFEGLGEAVGGEAGSAEDARARLFERLDSTKRLLKEAERRAATAAQAAAEASRHAADVAARRTKLDATLGEVSRHLLAERAANEAVEAGRARDALRELGRPAAGMTLDGLLAQVRDVQSVGTRAIALWHWLAGADRGRRERLWLTLLYLLPFGACTAGLWWLTNASADRRDALLSVLPVLLGVLTRVRTATAAVGAAVARLEGAQREIARIQSEAESRRLAEVKRHEEAQARLAREEHEARVARDEAQRRLDEVQREIEDIKAGRRLYRYIQERARSDDYRKYQGVISLVRDDFQQLSLLLRAAVESDEPGDVPPIERIVLYIDDLDRCPEERVVEVLQAVHLILAFDLFVVVVGVDSRWLLHALQSQYAAFVRPANELGLTREEVAHWATSPQNYLEKIFQIPFTLRPMDREGYRRLVSSLVRPIPAAPPVPRAAAPVPAAGAGSVGVPSAVAADAPAPGAPSGADDGEHREGERRGTPEARQLYDRRGEERRGAPAAALDARHGDEDDDEAEREREAGTLDALARDLELDEDEVRFMLTLDRLIPSPRATKRFVNVYRLFRAAVADGGQLEKLLAPAPGGYEPAYRAVLVLLAMLTGYPAQAPDVFRALEHARPSDGWWGFVREVARAEIARHDALAPSEWTTPLAVDHTLWQLLAARLATLEEKLGYSDTLAPFVLWAPRVARYSFQSGRVSAWDHGAGRVSRPAYSVPEPSGAPAARA